MNPRLVVSQTQILIPQLPRHMVLHHTPLLSRLWHLDIVGIQQPIVSSRTTEGGYKIMHVAFRFREFHLVHALAGIPMLFVRDFDMMRHTKKALRRNIALNCSPMRLKSS